ncbi:DUF4190 domain-containing protein [Arthrobacter luteolus]|uniref:DUF4190 domain-containing protein n=1 Tax=Arthrobacter luteolus TaxID=98672 RepID=UPI0008362684|nr:DUF4190 domain-containing protein [Arthrobacter luteolus]
MPENRNDDAGQPAGEPNGFAAPGQPHGEATPEGPTAAGQAGSTGPAQPAGDTPPSGGAPTQPLYGEYSGGQNTEGQYGGGQNTEGQYCQQAAPHEQQYGQGQQQSYGQQADPGQPVQGQPTPYGQQQYGQQAPYGQQQPYGTPNYGYPGTYQAPAQKPGKVMGIVGLVLSCLFFIPYASVAGLILSIIGLVQSRKAKESNGPALAGIIIGAVVLAITVIATIFLFVFAAGAVFDVVEVCQEYGPGTHFVDGMTYECGVNSTGFEQSL